MEACDFGPRGFVPRSVVNYVSSFGRGGMVRLTVYRRVVGGNENSSGGDGLGMIVAWKLWKRQRKLVLQDHEWIIILRLFTVIGWLGGKFIIR